MYPDSNSPNSNGTNEPNGNLSPEQPTQPSAPAPAPKKGMSALFAVVIVLVLALGVAAYFMFMAPKETTTTPSANNNTNNEETAPDYSTVKSAELVIPDLAKTKQSYLPQNDSVYQYTAQRQAERAEKLASGKLVPLQDFKLDKIENGSAVSFTSFFIYDLQDGLDKSSILDIIKQRDDVQKAGAAAQGGTVTYSNVGTPPTISIKDTDGKSIVLATQKRKNTFAKDGQSSDIFVMTSYVKLGSKLFAANYSAKTEQLFNAGDAQMQDMVQQVQVKLTK